MQALNAVCVRQSFSITRCNSSQEKKPRRRRTKEERKSMVESFITKYRISHNGSFPSLNLTHKEVGGSFYTVREIMRDIIQENKVLGPGNASMKSLKFEDFLEGDDTNYLTMTHGKESSISFIEHEVDSGPNIDTSELSEYDGEESFQSLYSHQPEDIYLTDVSLSHNTHHHQSNHLQKNSEVGSENQQTLITEELKDNTWTSSNPKRCTSLISEENNFEGHVDSENSSIQNTEQVESSHLSFSIDSLKVRALNDDDPNNDILTEKTNIAEINHADCRTFGEDTSQNAKIHSTPFAFDAYHELSNSSASSCEMLFSVASDPSSIHKPETDQLKMDRPTGFKEFSANQSEASERTLSTPANNIAFTPHKTESGDVMFHSSVGGINHQSPISRSFSLSLSNDLKTEVTDAKEIKFASSQTTSLSQKMSKVEPKAEKEINHSNTFTSSSNSPETIEASGTQDNNPVWGTIKRIVASFMKFLIS